MALPVFTGHHFDPMGATAFLQDFDNYCHVYEIDDDHKPSTIASALKDDARAWLLQLKNITAVADFDWAHIREQFLVYWTAPVPRANRFQLAADCKQKSGEAVRTFLSRCCNVAFETITPMTVETLGGLGRTVTVPARPAEDGTPAQIERDISTTFSLEEDELREVNMYYAKEFAMNLFVAGCHPQVRHHLVLDKSWESWEDLMGLAISIEATVAPNTLSRALKQFDPALSKSSGVAAVSDTAPAPAAPPVSAPTAPSVAAVGQGRSTKPPRQKGRQQPRQPPKSKPPQPQAPPDPQQRRTHQQPVVCYFCGGQYHTERHCLAKQRRLAMAPQNAVSMPQNPPPVQWPQQFYVTPDYYNPAPSMPPAEHHQLATVATPAPYVPMPAPAPSVQPPQPLYPQPHFFGGE